MIRTVLLLVAAICFSTTRAHAGISTNGAAFKMEEENVWFLGSKPVEYCIESAGLTKLDDAELDRLVRESFADWIAFFREYNLDRNELTHLKGEKHLKVSLHFKQVATCTTPETQIRFLFGITSPKIADALENEEGAIALNLRDGLYNHDSYRNGGIIYIADRQLGKERLRHVILHELGHVFGLPHDSVYVMDGAVAYSLVDQKINDSAFGHIESATWKYRLHENAPIQFGDSATLKFDRDSMTAELRVRDQVLKGFFKSDAAFPPVNQGPSVHLVMMCSECEYSPDCSTFCGTNAYGITKYLDPFPSLKALTGTFTDGSTVYPATITNDHGTHVRLFDTKSLEWKAFN